MTYTTRPLVDKTWYRPDLRRPTRFTAKWADTVALLSSEVAALDGQHLVIQVDITEADLRRDGQIRANAKAASPGVIVSFECRTGPLMFRCDRLTVTWHTSGADWQQNVRAIALTLESLRAVDRYGATSSGEQYAGWRQLADRPAPPMADEAWATLVALSGLPADTARDRVIRVARRRAHPDTGGSTQEWAVFQNAVAAVDPAHTIR